MKKINKPWGYELLFALTKNYAGKILFIREGEELSLQYHRKKEESIYVARGVVEVTLEKKRSVMKRGEALHIAPNTQHRIKALEEAELFEVSTPELQDVVRLQDRYGRV